MARTRMDPWLTEQPDEIWRQSTLASIIPDLPGYAHNDSQNKTPKKMKVLLPNPLAKSQQPESNTWNSSTSKPVPDSPPFKPYSFPKESLLSSSHLPFKKKHKSKHLKRRHNSNDEFEAATSKVLAALSMSRLAPVNVKSDEFEEYKPKRMKLMSLPDNDSRKNMIPKVVLQDIGSLISKICPKVLSTFEDTHSKNSPSPTKMSKAFSSSMSSERRSSVLPAMSPTKTRNSFASSMSCDERNQGLASTEKSFTPFSKKVTTFATLASAAPSFSNSPIASHSSFSWPSSSKLLSAKPVESDSSQSSTKLSPLLPDSPLLDGSDKTNLNRKNSDPPRSFSRESQVTETLKVSPPALHASRQSSRKSSSIYKKTKPGVPIKHGFLGFAQEDGKKSRVCFHVNTNILASSLDLLDLHKHSEIPSGSPTTCPHCNVTFSSVKHCKYHQTFTLADISLVPSHHNNIQENDLWLCPWCPLMATSVMLLNSHKARCREKDRCHQEEKASSVRKNPPISSSQRTSPNGTFKSLSKYKVVHGEVIQL